MKTVFLIPSNVAGGAERVMTTLANKFADNKNETWLIQFDINTNFYDINDNVNKISLNVETGNIKGLKKWLYFPMYYKRLKVHLKKINPDVVISFLFLTNIVGVFCCKKLHIPIILSERNDPREYGNKQKKVMKYVYPKSNGFVCQSNVVKEYIEEEYGIENSVVIENPLNENQVGKINDKKDNQIISVGRLIPQKNFGLLIDAFEEVTSDMPEFKLTIYGEGFLREELENKIKKLGLNKKVSLPGNKKDVIKINNKAKIFVLSSDFEGYPNVLAEAMANGLVCIASDVPSGTTRQIIKHGVNGFLYKVNDKEALSELLLNVMKMADEDCKKITEEAVKIYEKTNIDIIYEIWTNYILYVLNKQ